MRREDWLLGIKFLLSVIFTQKDELRVFARGRKVSQWLSGWCSQKNSSNCLGLEGLGPSNRHASFLLPDHSQPQDFVT